MSEAKPSTCEECGRIKSVLREFLAAVALLGSAKIGLGPYKNRIAEARQRRIRAWDAAMEVAAYPNEDIFDLMGTPDCEPGEARG